MCSTVAHQTRTIDPRLALGAVGTRRASQAAAVHIRLPSVVHAIVAARIGAAVDVTRDEDADATAAVFWIGATSVACTRRTVGAATIDVGFGAVDEAVGASLFDAQVVGADTGHTIFGHVTAATAEARVAIIPAAV